MLQKYAGLIIASILLGLAPFYPEPHLWKQYHRIMDGSFGELMDWLDLVLHGGPILVLLGLLAMELLSASNSKTTSKSD